MKILIIGNGGREHALAWKASQSPQVNKIYVAPGNAGTASEPKVENIPILVTDIEQLLNFAQKNSIDLTIIGPEAPLSMGIVDQFRKEGLSCFGPTQAASRLESSKVFCKDFLTRHQIPTAKYACFSDISAAENYIKNHSLPIVIKADGLAAGKGVIIAYSRQEAFTALQEMLTKDTFGEAGKQVVIEEFLSGEEASFIVMSDGKHILPLASSQDYKARDNGDKGPNTGGMGAYSPAPVITSQLYEKVLKEVILPTINAMAAEGTPYTGFLYAGLMVTPKNDLKVLEYNCRLGDPETEPLMLRLQSDLIELCQAALKQELDQTKAIWDSRTALGVVLASKGYPAQYPTGEIIQGLSMPSSQKNWKVFHAGTRTEHQDIVTAGGRVLCVTALGDSVTHAQKLAYEIVKKIYWPHIYYRTDIGYRAIAYEHRKA